MFQGLVRLEGWDELAKVAKAQIANRVAESGQLALGLDHMIKKELLRTESYGIELVLRLPELFLKEVDDIIDKFKSDEE